MTERGEPRQVLAARLRELRSAWDDLAVGQKHVAEAIGASVALVSSWEKGVALPPEERLKAYARFFATRRSREQDSGRLIPVDDLTPAEDRLRQELVDELVRLREEALDRGVSRGPSRGALGGRFWYLPGAQQITILCTPLSNRQLGLEEDGKLPAAASHALQYAVNPTHPNSITGLRNGDIDALLELVGHLRAENPSAEVRWTTNDSITRPEQLSGHVVLLGGADSNGETPRVQPGAPPADLVVWEFLRLLELPVTTSVPEDVDEQEFDFRWEVQLDQDGAPAWGGPGREPYSPRFRRDESRPGLPRLELDGAPVLDYDVALIARRPNPFNSACRVTLCSGMFSRGTYGAVRAFTDAEYRARNERYIADHADADDFWMLVQVPVFLGTRTMTPDLAKASHRLTTSF